MVKQAARVMFLLVFLPVYFGFCVASWWAEFWRAHREYMEVRNQLQVEIQHRYRDILDRLESRWKQQVRDCALADARKATNTSSAM